MYKHHRLSHNETHTRYPRGRCASGRKPRRRMRRCIRGLLRTSIQRDLTFTLVGERCTPSMGSAPVTRMCDPVSPCGLKIQYISHVLGDSQVTGSDL